MATAELLDNGSVINYTNSTGGTLEFGQVFLIGKRIAIACERILNGSSGKVRWSGEAKFPAASADTFTEEQSVYWNATDGEITDEPSSIVNDELVINAYVGIVTKAKAALEVVCNVKFGSIAERTGGEVGKVYTNRSSIALGQPSGRTQVATIQLKDINGVNIAEKRTIKVFMGSTAGVPSSSGVATSVTPNPNHVIKTHTSKLFMELVTDATGKSILTFDNTGGSAAYTDCVILIIPHTNEMVISSELNVSNT